MLAFIKQMSFGGNTGDIIYNIILNHNKCCSMALMFLNLTSQQSNYTIILHNYHGFVARRRTTSLCSHIFLVLWDQNYIVCCLHLKTVFRSCPKGCQWCGIFHYLWCTVSIKPSLLFSLCRLCCLRTFPFSQNNFYLHVLILLNVLQTHITITHRFYYYY